MESMDTSGVSSPVKQRSTNSPSLHLWYFGDKVIEKTTLENLNLSELTVGTLKELALRRTGRAIAALSVDELDVLYNGRVLEDKKNGVSLESLNIKSNTVLHVVKKIGTNGREAKLKQFQEEPLKKIPKETVSELAIALKTLILSPNFFSAIDKLSDPQTMRNVLAVVPNLRHDPVGIAIVQDPSMILYLADDENLKNLAANRPWVVEALNFIAAGIHQHEGSSKGTNSLAASRTPGLHSLLSYMRQIEEEDEDERMEGGAAGGPGPSQRPQITRDQLVAALESFNNLSRGSSNPLLSSIAPRSGASASGVPQAGGQGPLRFPADPLGLLAGAGASPATRLPTQFSPSTPAAQPTETPPPLSGDLVARAVRDAINQLPPDQRAAQINAFRSLAMSLQGNDRAGPQASTPTPAPQAVPPSTGSQSGASTLSAQYREQLAQMREMGIYDERLSIMALRVSEGDVATAVELIFSGWTGEGLE